MPAAHLMLPRPHPQMLLVPLLVPLLLLVVARPGRGPRGRTGDAAVAPCSCCCWVADQGTAAAPAGRHGGGKPERESRRHR